MRSVLLVTLALAIARPANAADENQQRAAEHFGLAESAERREDWPTAIQEYEQAYALSPHPAMLYNIAKNHERMGNAVQALLYYRSYEAAGGDPSDAGDAERVRERIAALRRRLAPPGGDGARGRLWVVAKPDGAQVKIDGAPVGAAPLSYDLSPGNHRIVVSAPNHTEAKQDVVIVGGEGEVLALTLTNLATPDGGKPAPEPRTRVGLGVLYGFSSAERVRFQVLLSLAAPSERWEFDLFYGTFAQNDTGGGAAVRLVLSHGLIRPYMRLAATLGKADNDDLTYGGEFGAGAAMYYGTPSVSQTAPGQYVVRTSYGYFLQFALRTAAGGVDETEAMELALEQTSRFAFSIDFGLAIRW